jgi:hypothetical protein
MENSIFEVLLNGEANFHPKLWCISFKDHDYNQYIKIVILSRNLTFDRSFDIAAVLMGKVETSSTHNICKPLADMLRYVAKYAESNSPKHEKILQLADDLTHIKDLQTFKCFDPKAIVFHPIGIADPGKKDARVEKFEADLQNASRILLVSPFLSVDVVKKLTAKPWQKTLITRKLSVTKEIMDCFDGVYVTKDQIMDDGSLDGHIDAEDDLSINSRDIHAKIIFEERTDGNKTKNYLYLGSLNASDNAFYHNVEFMVELKFNPKCTSYNAILKDFLPQEDKTPCPFELLSASNFVEAETEKEDNDDFRDVLHSHLKAQVEVLGSKYNIRVNCDYGNVRSPVEIAPFRYKKDFKPLNDDVVFEDVDLRDLSEFFYLRRGKDCIIVKIDIRGIPYAERDNAIYNTEVSQKGFMNYVSYILSGKTRYIDQEIPDFGIDANENTAMDAEDTPAITFDNAVYEQLLDVAADNPEQIDYLENLMKHLDDNIVDKKFRDLVAVCKQAAKKGKIS